MPLRSILRSIKIIIIIMIMMVVVVVVHILSQLLNATLATNFIVGTNKDGLFTRRDLYITVSTICAKNCRI
jgi:hypothetical protein